MVVNVRGSIARSTLWMWATPPCLLQKDIPGMKVFGLFHKDAQDSNDRRFRIKEESGYNRLTQVCLENGLAKTVGVCARHLSYVISDLAAELQSFWVIFKLYPTLFLIARRILARLLVGRYLLHNFSCSPPPFMPLLTKFGKWQCPYWNGQ